MLYACVQALYNKQACLQEFLLVWTVLLSQQGRIAAHICNLDPWMRGITLHIAWGMDGPQPKISQDHQCSEKKIGHIDFSVGDAHLCNRCK